MRTPSSPGSGFGKLFRMISAADQKVGRSTFQYYDELRQELEKIREELDELLKV